MKAWNCFFLLQAALLTCCGQKAKMSFKKNEFSGITKVIFNEKSKGIVDSVFDNFNQLKKVIEYFDQGHRKSIKQYKDGFQDSVMISYYYNGVIKSKSFYFQGKQCFERIDYSEQGKVSEYIFLSSDQSNIYIRSYDSLGNCYNIRGTPFFESYMYSNPKNMFSIYDTVKTLFYVPTPPDCNAVLYTVYGNKEVNNIKPIKESFIYRVKIYPLSKGSYDWFVRMKLFNKKDDSLIYTSEMTKITYKVR